MRWIAAALLLCPQDVVKLAGDMGFTEGPVWVPAERALVFSDIPAAKLMRWSAAAGLEVRRASEHANGNLLDLEGRLLSCQHGARNVVREEADGSLTVVAERFEGKRFNSPNDLTLRSDGTLWFTDPPWGLANQREGKELPGNWVFRVSPEGAVTVALRSLVMPNGIALSPDEQRLYVADTGGLPWFPDPERRDAPATVSAYAIGADDALSARPVWRIETRCDGMCVDARGNLYTTGAEGVEVWSPDGERLRSIAVPEQPSNVCFGGDDFRTLFITARTSLYSIELEVAGHAPKKRAAGGDGPRPDGPDR